MKFEVKTDPFKKVISSASRASSSKAIQPILNNILISGKQGSLLVKATDLDLAIECKIPAEVEEEGETTLPAKKLEEIVNKVTGQEMSLKIDENQSTKITSDKAKFQISGKSSDEFPEIKMKEDEEIKIIIDQEILKKAFYLTSFATSKIENATVLGGVLLMIHNEELEVVASDGGRFARFFGQIKEKGIKENIIIPFRAVSEIEKLIDTFSEGNKEVEIIIQKGKVVFQNKDFSLSTRVIDGKYPEYEKLIPKKLKYNATFVRNDLISCLERVSVLANERTNVVKIKVGAKKDTAIFTANSPDYGNANDEIKVKYEGEEVEISFNYRFLLEALRKVEEKEVRIEMEAPILPLILKQEDKGYKYTHLVMPVQLR